MFNISIISDPQSRQKGLGGRHDNHDREDDDNTLMVRRVSHFSLTTYSLFGDSKTRQFQTY